MVCVIALHCGPICSLVAGDFNSMCDCSALRPYLFGNTGDFYV